MPELADEPEYLDGVRRPWTAPASGKVPLHYFDAVKGSSSDVLQINHHITAEEYLRCNDCGEIWMTVLYPHGDDLPGVEVVTTCAAFLEAVDECQAHRLPLDLRLYFPSISERAAGRKVELLPQA